VLTHLDAWLVCCAACDQSKVLIDTPPLFTLGFLLICLFTGESACSSSSTNNDCAAMDSSESELPARDQDSYPKVKQVIFAK